MIKRNQYLQKLIHSMNNGFPKVITGIRRCGKSYLLKEIFYQYLVKQGVSISNIIILELDDIMNFQYRNPLKLIEYLTTLTVDPNQKYYIIIDEIQFITPIINPEFTDGKIVVAKNTDLNTISFVDVVLGLSRKKNIDLYVTGSNSRLLSKDILTQFRDKATNIHVQPLSFQEYYEYVGGEVQTAFYEYMRHGGMPLAVLNDYNQKETYLKDLFELTYFKDILEHHSFHKSETLDDLCDTLSFASGQLLNTQKISNIIESRKHEKLDPLTIQKYLLAFEDSYLISEAKRYDVKGNKAIGATRKYYFTDTGLRNARLNFTSLDTGQMIENIVYNELIYHGYNVKVGTFNQVEKNKEGKSVMKNYEVDFYATKENDSIYIQVTDHIDEPSIRQREIRPFFLIKDSIRKVILVNRPIQPMMLENGIILDGITHFILNL